MLPFSIDDLEKALAEGDVTKRSHPFMPYDIYNYSPAVQYSNKWNDVTLNCRGLILDENYKIIARPWKKFFNLGQVNLPIQFDDPVEVMDKADGSLGILYPTDDGYAIATRGSFMSEQAIHATKVWEQKYSHLRPCDDVTMLFEIVYPENRIVLNYDGMDDLILLGSVSTQSGYYFGPRESVCSFYMDDNESEQGAVPAMWEGPVVETYPFKSISDALGKMGRSNKEGYVIRSHNFMVKVKEPDYLELHRLVTNMTPKTIWEQLKAGKSVSEICADLPDEFHSQAEDIAKPLRERYNARLNEILSVFSLARYQAEMKAANTGLDQHCSRKQYAETFKKFKDAKYFFSLLDERPINELLWNELKPKETVSAQED